MGFDEGILWIGRAVEGVGVAAILVGVLVSTWGAFEHRHAPDVYARYRQGLGRALLLGLELLVAGDVIRTVTTRPSIETASALAIIVLVRTFLSLSIELEVEGRFPWQRSRGGAHGSGAEGRSAERAWTG